MCMFMGKFRKEPRTDEPLRKIAVLSSHVVLARLYHVYADSDKFEFRDLVSGYDPSSKNEKEVFNERLENLKLNNYEVMCEKVFETEKLKHAESFSQ